MRFRIHLHSSPGTWKYLKGYVDVNAPTIHQAVARAMHRLYTGVFPNRPKGAWVVDSVRVKRLAFEAEQSMSR